MFAVSDIVHLAQQFGSTGLVVAFMIWDRLRVEKIAKEREQCDRDLARDRIDTDKVVAGAMAILSTKIDGMKH